MSVSEATDDSVRTDMTELPQVSSRRQYRVVLRLDKAKLTEHSIYWKKPKSPETSVSFWSVFKCIEPQNERKLKKTRYFIETRPYEMRTEYQRRHSSSAAPLPEALAMATMNSMRRSLSNNSVATAKSSDVSNSSLKDYDKGALQDELTLYMEELMQSQK